MRLIASVNRSQDSAAFAGATQAQSATTVVMVTHERATAERYANRIITLADGRVISEETTARQH